MLAEETKTYTMNLSVTSQEVLFRCLRQRFLNVLRSIRLRDQVRTVPDNPSVRWLC